MSKLYSCLNIIRVLVIRSLGFSCLVCTVMRIGYIVRGSVMNSALHNGIAIGNVHATFENAEDKT
jgi:hypothetical protein